MKEFKHDVLGTPYTIKVGSKQELGLEDSHFGVCRVYAKEILISNDLGDNTERELENKIQEAVAHEFFHAYLNESGTDLDTDLEERLATLFMRVWRKLNNSILEVLDEIEMI